MNTEKSFYVRKLSAIDDFEQALEVQRKTWSFEERDLLPAHFMIAFKEYGEQWGAFIDDTLVAIALSYPVDRNGNYLLHMLGTIPEYRHLGIGSNLLSKLISIYKNNNANKLFWTYDPFDFTNSKLYLNKIGAKGTATLLNYYGRLHSEHHGQLPTHRLLCEIDFNSFSFDTDEKKLLIPMNEKKLRTIESQKAVVILNDWFNELSSLISNGWIITNFELSQNQEMGNFTLKKIIKKDRL
jgi:predicted GNAT superfamily acetyltransferase